MSERVRPKLAPRGRRSTSTACPRGHEVAGYNALPRSGTQRPDWKPGCRACMAAFQWARRHNLFNDDPRVIARADEMFAKYQEKDAAQR